MIFGSTVKTKGLLCVYSNLVLDESLVASLWLLGKMFKVILKMNRHLYSQLNCKKSIESLINLKQYIVIQIIMVRLLVAIQY